MVNANEILKVLERDAEIHKGKVYIPVNSQILTQAIDILKEVIANKVNNTVKTTTKRTRKNTK